MENSFYGTLTDIFENRLPFNKLLGLKLEIISNTEFFVRFEMDDKFIGNQVQGILHGGVISSVLDVTGGLTAILTLSEKLKPMSWEKLATFGTIDLRVDYLRPGRGQSFTATGETLRTGNKIAVSRMQLLNEDDVLIAVGTGTYLVG